MFRSEPWHPLFVLFRAFSHSFCPVQNPEPLILFRLEPWVSYFLGSELLASHLVPFRVFGLSFCPVQSPEFLKLFCSKPSASYFVPFKALSLCHSIWTKIQIFNCYFFNFSFKSFPIPLLSPLVVGVLYIFFALKLPTKQNCVTKQSRIYKSSAWKTKQRRISKWEMLKTKNYGPFVNFSQHTFFVRIIRYTSKQ